MVNWASYNKSLVRRGEVILDFDIIDGWYDELEKMNEGKKRLTLLEIIEVGISSVTFWFFSDS